MLISEIGYLSIWQTIISKGIHSAFYQFISVPWESNPRPFAQFSTG